jgi:histidyl-tRNA synthetase
MFKPKIVEEKIAIIPSDIKRFALVPGLLKKAASIAEYYGFLLVKPIPIKKTDLLEAKSILGRYQPTTKPSFEDCPQTPLEEKLSLIRCYVEKDMKIWPQPVMLCYIKKGGKNSPAIMRMEVIGSPKSFSEAVLIHTTVCILKELGHNDIFININSVGDKESATNFTKELTAYYRKNINTMETNCRELFKKDPYKLLETKDKKCVPANEESPKAISFLSDASRQHFKEVLEFLEIADIPYRINHSLVGTRNYQSETIFEICALGKDLDPDGDCEVLARGARSNNFGKKLGNKKDIPTLSVSIKLKNIQEKEVYHEINFARTKKPRIYFIQLGLEAKLRSLAVMEKLRKAKIPIYQSLNKDKIALQIAVAEKLKAPLTIIMGQKEVLDNTVIVRDMESRSQEIIDVCDLVQYLKKHRHIAKN